jgi:CDP-diacylglycerol--glycerol-3-phosphate 3-phosphatidyltransferase
MNTSADPTPPPGAPTPPESLFCVPNLLSAARVPLAVALFACVVHEAWLVGLLVFLVATATDWLDGWWARRYGPLTLVGRNLDPMTDKVLVCGAFLYLLSVPGAGLTPWMVTVVISRELIVTGLRGIVEAAGKKFGADWFGKLKMGLQCAWVSGALLTLWLHANGFAGPWLDWLLVAQLLLLWLTILATVGSGLQYCVKAARLLRPGGPTSLPPGRQPRWVWLVPAVVVLGAAGLAAVTGPRDLDRYPPAAESPYRLPWRAGVGHLCVQGNRGFISHFGREELAYDFAMPVGTEVCAARGGVVRQAEVDHEGYGPWAANNHVVVDHGDGTVGVYGHLRRGGSRVRVGERVARGQVIGHSGNVGTSLMPHLHFHVYDNSARLVPVTFPEAAGDGGVPRMFRSYTSDNTGP